MGYIVCLHNTLTKNLRIIRSVGCVHTYIKFLNSNADFIHENNLVYKLEFIKLVDNLPKEYDKTTDELKAQIKKLKESNIQCYDHTNNMYELDYIYVKEVFDNIVGEYCDINNLAILPEAIRSNTTISTELIEQSEKAELIEKKKIIKSNRMVIRKIHLLGKARRSISKNRHLLGNRPYIAVKIKPLVVRKNNLISNRKI